MRKSCLVTFIALAALFAACAAEPAEMTTNPQAPLNEAAEPKDELSDSPASEPDGGGRQKEDGVSIEDASSGQTDVVSVDRRMIIRSATIRLESNDPSKTQKAIVDIVKKLEGFVLDSQSSVSGDQVRPRNRFSVSLRVPAEKLDEALELIRRSGSRVLSESIKGEDVTEKYIDVEARLKAKKALEAQFLEIMKRASTVKDALEVQRELSAVRAEIERIEGSKKSLERLSRLSRVTVEIIPPGTFSTNSGGFWYQLKDAVGDGFEGALTFLLFLVRVVIALVPFLLLIVLPVLLVLRYLWRRYKKVRAARAVEKAESGTDDL